MFEANLLPEVLQALLYRSDPVKGGLSLSLAGCNTYLSYLLHSYCLLLKLAILLIRPPHLFIANYLSGALINSKETHVVVAALRFMLKVEYYYTR